MPKRASPLIALVLTTVVLVVYAPILLGGQTWDDQRYHVEIAPSRIAAAEIVQRGELPTWWNGTALGVPLVGEPSHGAAYPPVWIGSTPRLLDLLWVVHLLWCALGVALWARRSRASELGAVVAGVLVATSGLFAGAALRGALPALAHVPWIALFASRLASASQRSDRVRYSISIALLVGLVGLAGELAVLGHAIVLACLPALRAWRWVVPALTAGLLIATVQWLPALLAMPDAAGHRLHALPLSRLVELIVPGSFTSQPQIAGSAPWFPSLYVGAPLFALAAISGPRRRYAVLAFVLAVLALVVGRGGWPGWLGAPELHISVLVLVAAAHAGRGFDVVIASERRAIIALAGAAVAIVLALGGLVALRTRVQSDLLDRALIGGGLALICAAGALLLAWRTTWLARSNAFGAVGPERATDELPARDGAPLPHPRRIGVDVRSLAIVVLIVAPSVGSVAITAPTMDRELVDESPAWADAAVAQTDFTVVGDERVAAQASGAPLRVFRPIMSFAGDRHADPETIEDALATFAGSSPAKWGIAVARSDDPARPREHDRVWLAAAAVGGELLARYGVGLAILPTSMVQGRGMRQVATRGSWSLVRFPASPPAALVYEWIFVRDVETAIARMFPPGAGHGLSAGVLVLHGSGVENQDEPSAPQPCTIERWTASVIDLVCNAERPAYAVVSSTAADGWTAQLDGRDTPWLVADVMRRAIAVPAGEHRIRWRYSAPGLTIALVLAALGIAGLFALWLVHGRDSDARDEAAGPERTEAS